MVAGSDKRKVMLVRLEMNYQGGRQRNNQGWHQISRGARMIEKGILLCVDCSLKTNTLFDICVEHMKVVN
jgi:hypothetical protein